MSELPPKWAVAKLQEITPPDAAIIYGVLQPGPDIPGGVPYVRPTEIQEGRVSLGELRRTSVEIAARYRRSTLKANDVLLSIVGTIGKVAIAPPELDGANITQSSCRIRPDSSITSARFLAYFLRSPLAIAQYDSARLGTAVPRLNLEDVRDIEIPIPPFEEQTRIVNRLEPLLNKLNACGERLERMPQILKRFREAVLEAAVSGKLTEEWRQQQIAKTRRHTTLRDISVLITKGASPRWQGISYVGAAAGGTLFVTSENVREYRVDLKIAKYLDSSFNELQKRSILRRGDLLTNIVGASIGRTAIYESDEIANINQAVCVIRLKKDIAPRYVLYAMNSPSIVKFLHQEKVDVARANLSLQDIGNIPLEIPDLAEQREIVRRVDEMFELADSFQHRYMSAAAAIQSLVPSILSKAFFGELVPQDPTDEPASVLLERIRTGRAEEESAGKRRARRSGSNAIKAVSGEPDGNKRVRRAKVAARASPPSTRRARSGK